MVRTIENKEKETLITKAKLWGSLLLFTQVFYQIRTGREFSVSQPTCREPHVMDTLSSLNADITW